MWSSLHPGHLGKQKHVIYQMVCRANQRYVFRWYCLRRGKAVVPAVRELRETPYGGTLWFRYSNELTANTTTPPETIWYVIKEAPTANTLTTHGANSHLTLPTDMIFMVNRKTTPIISSDISRSSPIGLGTAMTCVQSKGRLLRDQMTGWTFCIMLREMATMLQVSWRTATRLAGGPESGS